jgi:hypothetical protein
MPQDDQIPLTDSIYLNLKTLAVPVSNHGWHRSSDRVVCFSQSGKQPYVLPKWLHLLAGGAEPG